MTHPTSPTKHDIGGIPCADQNPSAAGSIAMLVLGIVVAAWTFAPVWLPALSIVTGRE